MREGRREVLREGRKRMSRSMRTDHHINYLAAWNDTYHVYFTIYDC